MRYAIREARPEELPELADRFHQGYVDNLLAIPMPRDEAETLSDLAMRQVILRAADYKDLLIIVADDTEENRIAAGLAIVVIPAIKSSQGLYMWVREEYRGRLSFTRKLFRHTEVVLHERGANRVEFGVLTSNERALRIYEHLGYRTYAHTMVKRLDG